MLNGLFFKNLKVCLKEWKFGVLHVLFLTGLHVQRMLKNSNNEIGTIPFKCHDLKMET